MIFIIKNDKILYETEIQYDDYGNVYLKDENEYYRLEIIDNKPIFEYITELERKNNSINEKQKNEYHECKHFITLELNYQDENEEYEDITYTKKIMVKKCKEQLKQNPLYNTDFIINNNVVKKIFSKNNTATYNINIKNEGKIEIENKCYCYNKKNKKIECYSYY